MLWIYWLLNYIPGDPIFLQIHENLLHTGDFFVHFIAFVNKRLVLDFVMGKIIRQILSKNALDFVIHNGNATSKRLVRI